MADDKDRVLMRLRDRPLSRLELSGAEQGIVVRLAAEGQVGRVELDAADVESVDIVCRVCSSGSSSCPKGDLQTPTRSTPGGLRSTPTSSGRKRLRDLTPIKPLGKAASFMTPKRRAVAPAANRVVDLEREISSLQASLAKDHQIAETERLNGLADRWTSAVQEMLGDMMNLARQSSTSDTQATMAGLLQHMRIDPELVRFDANEDTFV
ncbi:Swi5-dependent recombination DNA repair protein 1 like protein [Plasmodiophora brassicae]|uniref:Swi5-dependent recombination DNA repair protein 1 homolog n=1 Tax=Plasmodiophora brassicae TaxID=37360 RepID=A0A0G4IL98_PLABS|nr:hypothetical protein PBRA_004588 [Plasmodiophora brassicae]SPR00158.1 unnamed protein product [Plasmodiophora brassicae]